MTEPARTLTAWLRACPDAGLVHTLAARPDLASPVPADLAVVASRASLRMSVLRALEQVDRFGLELLEGVSALGGACSYDALRSAVGPAASDAAVRAGVDRLRTLLLLWGSDDRVHLTGAVPDLLPAQPHGLGRPLAAALPSYDTPRLSGVVADLGLTAGPTREDLLRVLLAHGSDPAALTAALDRAGADARPVVERLAAGGPMGHVPEALRPERLADASSPLRRLLALGLLVAVDPTTVELPREVALVVRGPAALGELHPDPPELARTPVPAKDVDAAAAAQAAELVRLVQALLEGWEHDPPPVLRAGGVGVRELRRAAKELDVTEAVAALLVEVAHAADLLAPGTALDADWVPTSPGYDSWLGAGTAARWTTLASAWLGMPRLPGLVGERDDRDKVLAALGPDVERVGAPAARAEVLTELAGLPRGQAPDADGLVSLLTWRGPRRGGRLRERLTPWTLTEAEVLGVTGRGALSTPGRALLAGDPARTTAALHALLPDPVREVLVQPDLTVVAPGPLDAELRRDLTLVADVESTGGATVFRVSEASVRRALDAGRTASELVAMFTDASRTPLPQSLTYLVADVSRRHGVLRAGGAASYLRCDDENLLSEVLAHRPVLALGVRRLAPSVLVCQAPPARLLEVLRRAGFAPAAEDTEGTVVVARAEGRRSTARRRPGPVAHTAPRPEHLADLVNRLRESDRASTEARGANATSVAEVLATLHEAVRAGAGVAISYVDAQGRATSRTVRPSRVEGGFVSATDPRTETTLSLALHRVTAVRLLEGVDEAAEPSVG